MSRLDPCHACWERTLRTKLYTRKDGSRGRFIYCVRPGNLCGYRREWEWLEDYPLKTTSDTISEPL